MTVYVVDSVSGCHVVDYENKCVILEVPYFCFGDGALWGRIWHARGHKLEFGETLPAEIRLISEL